MSSSAAILTLLSGCSTGLGGIVTISFGAPKVTNIGKMEAFSAGVMTFMAFFELLLPSFNEIGIPLSMFGFSTGILVFAIISKLIPEPEADEWLPNFLFGSSLSLSDDGTLPLYSVKKSKVDSQLIPQSPRSRRRAQFIRTAAVTAIGLSLHNFPEGIAVYLSTLHEIKLGVGLAIAIALHNIPEGIAVAAPVYYLTQNKIWTVLIPLVTGLCEPFGALLAGIVLANFLTAFIVQWLLSTVGGIMCFISFNELLPVAIQHSGGTASIVWWLVGVFGCSVLYVLDMIWVTQDKTP